MTPKATHADIAGSRYLALQRLARAQKRATAEFLQLYVLEGFLRRLTRSRHDERFVLKGGLLLAAFDLRRATRDVDLLALRTDNDPDVVARLIVEVASVEVEDGVVLLPDTITVETIRDGDMYPGVRAVIEARLATARIKFSVDVNVGDPVVPAPTRTPVPVLLGDERIDGVGYPGLPSWCDGFLYKVGHRFRAAATRFSHLSILGGNGDWWHPGGKDWPRTRGNGQHPNRGFGLDGGSFGTCVRYQLACHCEFDGYCWICQCLDSTRGRPGIVSGGTKGQTQSCVRHQTNGLAGSGLFGGYRSAACRKHGWMEMGVRRRSASWRPRNSLHA